MGISGSQQAYKQARFGIMRFGASRFGYFTPNVVVTIAGTDRTNKILWNEPHSVTLNKNDEPDVAEFVIGRNPGFVPSAGQVVVIGLGTAVNAEFAGQIIGVRHVRSNSTQYPRYAITCTDWRQLANRRLITTDLSGQSGTAIAVAIVAYMSGFSDAAVEADLATVDEFICVNETPTGALARLANLLGGGYYIDASKRVHLWGSGARTGHYVPTNPSTLTNSLYSLQPGFAPEYDYTQIRTRVIVEGKRTTCPLSIPAGVTLPGLGTLPVEDSSIFSASGGIARIGTQRVTYSSRNYPVTAGLNAEGSHVAADAAAGATTITLDDGTWAFSTGTSWCQIGDQIIYFGSAAFGGPDYISGIPASGFGSVQHSIGAGESVRALGMLVGVSGLTLAQDVGADVVTRAEEDDVAAQAAIAAIEGGDGIHEHIISDERLSIAGCTERAEAELAAFGEALLRATWVTYDMNARAGASQALNLSSPDALTGTLTIDSVRLDFPIQNHPPRRTCEASTARLATILDTLRAR